MAGVIAQETGWTPGMPFAMTETGYNDCNCSNYGGNKLANAAYTLNLFLDAFKAGSILTAYYELFDEPQYDGTGIAYEAHWGLFNADGTPKPSATSLRNFVAIIGDANSDGASFANCGAINYTLAGMPDSAKSLLMQKADGTYELVIWNDTNIMAGQSGNHTIGIDLGGSYDYSVFDPLIGTTAIQSGKGSSLSVNVSDHPVIIELGGAPGTNVSKVSTQAPSAANNSTTTKTVAGGSTGSQKQASLPSSGSSSAGGSGGTGSSTTPVVVSTSQSLSSSTGEKANGPATGAQTYSMNGLNGLATNFANWGGVTTLANNGEQQNYVPGQVSVNSDGSVTLSGRPANGSDNSSLPYVSGMVETSQTFSQQYGYFEIETKIPAGKGVWPAFWLFGKDSHAMYREVDVFEFTGDPHVLNFSTHFGSQGNGKTIPITLPFDASQGMHTYGVDWTPTTFTLYVDGKPLATQDATGFAGQGDMYMIANVALGGNWPGNPDSTTPFPATMPIKSIGAWAAPANQ
jgi:beta-glucanase (GH16 family)